MAKATLIAMSSPTGPEQEDDFNDWYENTHIPQLREAIPSISNVTRYREVDPTGVSQTIRYVAVYELDTDDVAAAAGQLGAAGQGGKLDLTTTMDMTSNPPVLIWARGV